MLAGVIDNRQLKLYNIEDIIFFESCKYFVYSQQNSKKI